MADDVIVRVTPIEIPLCDVDTTVIQQLDDEPNDVGGLTAAELKAKFDQVGGALKDYINNDLIPTIIAADATEQARTEAEEDREAQERQRQINEIERQDAEESRADAELAREQAEQRRASETDGIVARATVQADEAARQAQIATQGGNTATQQSQIATQGAQTATQGAQTATQQSQIATQGAQTATQQGNIATQGAQTATQQANLAKSYAVGGTGTRQGENTDNAKFYYDGTQQAYTRVDDRIKEGLDRGLLLVKTLAVTLSAANWTGDAAPFTQIVQVAAGIMTAAQDGEAHLAQNITAAQLDEAERCELRLSGQTATSLTFQATAAEPDVDIPVELTLYFTPDALATYFATKSDIDALTAADVGAIPESAKGAQNGVASLDSTGKVPAAQLPAMNYVPTSEKGAAGGVASLDSAGKVPSAQLPAMNYVPTTRKVNNKPLSADISLTAADVGARSSSWTPAASDLPVVPITKGGTGANTAAAARAALGLGNTDGALPIANGGTGVGSMTGTDYSAQRPRGIAFATAIPSSIPNGCCVAVYS